LISSGRIEGLDEVPHVLTCFLEVAELAKASLFVRLQCTPVRYGGGQADDADSVGSQLGQELREGRWADSLAEDLGLANQDIHINQVTV
jgi:hypothetical protein